MPMTPFIALLSVAAGGAMGASMRYGFGLLVASDAQRIPLGTLGVNIIGCLVAGFIATLLIGRVNVSPAWLLFLTTGVLGGFTTFSAFSLDTLRLAESGEIMLAGLNVVLNLFGSLLAVVLGWFLAKAFFP